MSSLINRTNSITEFVIGFSRYLRSKNFSISTDIIQDGLEAIQLMNATYQYDSLRETLSITFCKNKDNYLNFTSLFDQYWKEKETAENAVEKKKAEPTNVSKPKPAPNSIDTLKSWINSNSSKEKKETSLYSDFQSLEVQDFMQMNESEKKQIQQIIKQLGKKIALHKSRRWQNSHKGIIAPQKLIRYNLKYGGEIMDLSFKKKKEEKLKLVAICDVSRSMELYSHFFINFILSFTEVFKQVDTFVFATKLHQLKLPTSNMKIAIPELGSGTKIGGSMKQFVDHHLRKTVDKKTIVMILSDGWDTAEDSDIGYSIHRIQKASKKLIWLNPLMSNPNFEPTTKSLKEASPFIDQMLPVHNLQSLRAMFAYIKR